MIYFETDNKHKRQNFIDINIPSNQTQLDAYYNTRKSIFCNEQGIFEGSDYDKFDYCSVPIIAINHYLGAPDKVVGVVRIYESKKREWFGGRLGVIKEYRSFSKYTCPNLFKTEGISSLCELSVAAGLIYRAVSLANYIGCDKFSAYVQTQNVKLFKRLQWHVIDEVDLHGIKHHLMEANLKAYPPTPIYNGKVKDVKSLISIQNAA